MDREKLKQLIVLPLVFVSVFGLTWILRTRLFGVSSPRSRVAAIRPAKKIETKTSHTAKAVSNLPEGDEEPEGPIVLQLPPFPVIAKWGRNPFLTPEEVASLKGIKLSPSKESLPPSKGPPPPVAIKSIIIQGSNRVAAIDNSIVTEGEMVGEERVVEIRENGVMLARGDEIRFVEVPQPAFSRQDKPGAKSQEP